MNVDLPTAYEDQDTRPLCLAVCRQYLTVEEEEQISQQFRGHTWRRNNQVMWSGIGRQCAQRWADEREMQTLTTAMDILMVREHPSCLKSKKSPHQWNEYMKGASAVFAHHICKGEKVTVLSPPPPEKFHPSGLTNYQAIEEPILKGKLGVRGVFRIDMVHPSVKGAENFYYQVWPVDQTHIWNAQFGMLPLATQCWRKVKGFREKPTENGHQSNTNLAQPDQADHRMIPENVKLRDVSKSRAKDAKDGTKGGTVALNKKSKPEETVATTTQKQKVTKAKKVRQAGMVTKPENMANVRTMSKSKKASEIQKPPKAQEHPKAQKPQNPQNPPKPQKAPKPQKPQKSPKSQNPPREQKAPKPQNPQKPQKAPKGKKLSMKTDRTN